MVNVGKYLPNYTGPYISDGKFQTSVRFGQATPKDRLDKLSRLHDTAFKEFSDYGHRTAANSLYNYDAKDGDTMSKIAGAAVLYGNQVLTAAKGLSFNMPALVYGGVRNALDLHDYVKNEKRYKQDVKDLYAQDPMRGNVRYDPYATGSAPVPVSKDTLGGTKATLSDDLGLVGRRPSGYLGLGGRRPNTEPPDTEQRAGGTKVVGLGDQSGHMLNMRDHGGGWSKRNGGTVVRPRRKTRNANTKSLVQRV